MEKSESIIRPKPLKNFSGEKVVYVPVDVPSGIIRKHLHQTASRAKTTEWGTFFQLDGKVVLYQAMGAPLAVMSLELLIASGAKEILLLGFCGSLNPGLKTASVVSVNRAYADEGTSRHYVPGRMYFHSSPAFQKSIESDLSKRGLSWLRSTAVTTDAPFRETQAWLRTMQRKGCAVVDMETSAVFALASFRRIQAAALLIVSDELSAEKWQEGFFDSGLEEKVRQYFLPFFR